MTLKIIIFKDGKPIDQLSFDQPSITIGRKAGSDVPIKDPAVSGLHAKILRVGTDYLIQDQGSTNGTSVGGKPVKQQVLEHKDRIGIGEHSLQIMLAPKAQKPAPTAFVPISDAVVANKSPEAQQRRQAPVIGRAWLEVVKGKTPGTQIPLTDSMTTIGEPGVQVAAVSKRPQGHFIIHVDGGKEGNRVPLVNGTPTGFKSQKLEAGDVIEVAGQHLTYHLE